MIHKKGRLEIDPKRGVLYFFDHETGECLLRIEGVRNVPEGHQIEIHLVEPTEKSDRARLDATRNPGVIYALQIAGRPC
jgi:hypothetical protein